jgi:hypothetical protein
MELKTSMAVFIKIIFRFERWTCTFFNQVTIRSFDFLFTFLYLPLPFYFLLLLRSVWGVTTAVVLTVTVAAAVFWVGRPLHAFPARLGFIAVGTDERSVGFLLENHSRA